MTRDKALRFNKGEPELHYALFYPHLLEALAKVQSQGGVKYGYANWVSGGKPDAEYYDAAMRHLVSHFNGRVYDKDLGTLAIVQCIWNLMNLVEQNMSDYPVFDENFDQEAFVKKWKDHPKKVGRPEVFNYAEFQEAKSRAEE